MKEDEPTKRTSAKSRWEWSRERGSDTTTWLYIYIYLPEMMMLLFNHACYNSFVPYHWLCWDWHSNAGTFSSVAETAEIDYSTIHCFSLWMEFGIWNVSSGPLGEQLQWSGVTVEEGWYYLSSSVNVVVTEWLIDPPLNQPRWGIYHYEIDSCSTLLLYNVAIVVYNTGGWRIPQKLELISTYGNPPLSIYYS